MEPGRYPSPRGVACSSNEEYVFKIVHTTARDRHCKYGQRFKAPSMLPGKCYANSAVRKQHRKHRIHPRIPERVRLKECHKVLCRQPQSFLPAKLGSFTEDGWHSHVGRSTSSEAEKKLARKGDEDLPRVTQMLSLSGQAQTVSTKVSQPPVYFYAGNNSPQISKDNLGELLPHKRSLEK